MSTLLHLAEKQQQLGVKELAFYHARPSRTDWSYAVVDLHRSMPILVFLEKEGLKHSLMLQDAFQHNLDIATDLHHRE